MAIDTQIIQISSYELTASAEAFSKAIGTLSSVTMQVGPQGILRYSFYVNAQDGTAGATIVFRDPAAWLAQHDFATSLDEYKAFYKTIRLSGLRFFGNMSAEIRQWLEERNISYEYGGKLAAGFER